VVESQEEFDLWMARQKPKYYVAFPDKDPDAKKATPDSTANKIAAVTPQAK
jgi:cytochrome c oxidase subunit 2